MGSQTFNAGESLFQRNKDEDREQGSLAQILKVLDNIHDQSFNHGVDDCRVGLATEYSKILAGVVVLFSGVIPRHRKPEDDRLGKKAMKLGARIVNDSSAEVTHVISANLQTEKAKWARKQTSVQIVGPQWLDASEVLWKK